MIIIIGKTVVSNLSKIREAVKRIKYFGTSESEASQSDTTQNSQKIISCKYNY
ncbi:Variable major protein (plasmid) [Borrelia crocidurae DOU]|uniref:Variable major protein n=1 Tax=Borrelia crocidurae DOU TaxID=1293575 RepID=W5SM81_9SPIR|nr:Variable major protein [Borrelia crocidurae DOU]